MTKKNKVGLYAGTFDPVHDGHVSLIKRAVSELDLDALYCLPDRLPAHKPNAVDIVHRSAMLRLALDGIEKVHVLILSANCALFPETVQELGLDDADVYILIGSDSVKGLTKWQNAQELLGRVRFIVGLRDDDDSRCIRDTFGAIGIERDRFTLIETSHIRYSSSLFRSGSHSPHPKIVRYIRKHRLYEV